MQRFPEVLLGPLVKFMPQPIAQAVPAGVDVEVFARVDRRLDRLITRLHVRNNGRFAAFGDPALRFLVRRFFDERRRQANGHLSRLAHFGELLAAVAENVKGTAYGCSPDAKELGRFVDWQNCII